MTDATTEEIIQQHTQAIEDVTLSVASLTQALQSEAKRATESDDLQSGRTKSAEEKAASAEEKAAANAAALALKADATDLSTLSKTVSALSAKRSLADLAVYEEKDGKVEKTDDALVKKSEVTDEYSDLWVLETGEVVELYFTWDEYNEYFWLSNFEGWNGTSSSPPSFPAYYTTVLDAKAASETLLTCHKGGSEASITLKATRQVKKNALGLACIGDNVSEFANDAGYATTAEVDEKIETVRSELSIAENVLAGSISSTNTEVDMISQRVNVLSAKVDEANATLEEVV